MTRNDFINRLKRGLRGMTEEDRADVIADYDAHFEAGVLEGPRGELAYRTRLTGRQYIVVRLGLLEHHPHAGHEVRSVAPVALRVEISEV